MNHAQTIRGAVTGVRSGLALGSLLLVVISVSGCVSYRVPGGPANFRAMGITEEMLEEQTDVSISRRLERKPLASFPVTVAVVRVQDRNYSSYTSGSYGRGNYRIVTTRDVESDEAFDRIAALPMIRTLAPLSRLVVAEELNTELELREAAATVQAGMLLIYTFDTTFGVEEAIVPLSIITLGLFPDDEARVTTTVSAVLIDTRNGYVYGLTEATSHQTQLANNWTSQAAIDQSRRRAEQEAFDKLIEGIETLWMGVIQTYGPSLSVEAEG